MKQILILLIKLYQWTISPMIGPVCRFTPSCSHYTAQALQKHGVFKGSILGFKRICRCNALFPGGVDEVP